MGALLVLLGMGTAVIGAPVLLLREYRRLLAEARREGGVDRLPEAVVAGPLAAVRRSGRVARGHRSALRAAVWRRLVPAWGLGLALILLGVALAGAR